MAKLLREVLYDLRFIRSHALQPKWWKVLKVFVLVCLICFCRYRETNTTASTWR